MEGLAVTAVAFTVSLGLSWVLYEAVERPARRLLLRSRRSTERPPVVRQSDARTPRASDAQDTPDA